MSVSFPYNFLIRKNVEVSLFYPSYSFKVNNTNKREAILKRKGLFVIDRGDPEKEIQILEQSRNQFP